MLLPDTVDDAIDGYDGNTGAAMKFDSLKIDLNLATVGLAVRAPVLRGLQIALLAVMSWVGHALVRFFHLPLSGNLAGMLLTFVALQMGILRLEHFEAGGTLLMRHLPLLFIPLVVAVSGLGAAVAAQGAAILATLAVSAAAGFAMVGWTAQAFLSRHGARPPRGSDKDESVRRPHG